MKKHKAEYHDDFVTYWPHFGAGLGAICFFGFILVIILTMFLLCLIEGVAKETFALTAVLLVVHLLEFAIFLYLAIKSMYTKITITHKGICICNVITKKKTNILWDEVRLVCFHQDGWYGRKSYKIYLKNSIFEHLPAKKHCDYVIPTHFVDENIVREFIPQSLFGNTPQYNRW